MKIKYFIPLIVWLLILFALSSQPRSQQSTIPFLSRLVPKEVIASWLPDVHLRYGDVYIEAQTSPYHFVDFLFRKSAHIISYALLGCAFYCAFFGLLTMRNRPWIRWAAMFSGIAVVAYLDEWNQSRVPMRTGQSMDVWLDLVGGTIGASLLIFAFHAVRHTQRRGSRGLRASQRRNRKPPG